MSPERAFHLRKTVDGYEAEWVGLGTLTVGNACSFRALPDADEQLVEKLRRGPAAAVERYLRRSGLAFHASAVAVGATGVLFTGASGVGKSTMAAMSVRRGARALADDVAITRSVDDGIVVEPTEAVHLLDERSLRLMGLVASTDEKVPVVAPLAGGDVPLGAFIELTNTPFSCTRLSGIAAMHAIALARLCPPTDEPDRMKEDFEAMAKLAATVPTYRLGRGDGEFGKVWNLLSSICAESSP